jgi:predicted DNA-binding transcriptional regulator YafY
MQYARSTTSKPIGPFAPRVLLGRTWTLAAWCELRNSFGSFRLDRVGDVTRGDRFEDEPGRTLQDMLAAYGPAAVTLLD